MICPNCHSENKNDSRFCSHCATPLSVEETLSASLTKTMATPLPAISKDTLIAGKYKIIEEIGRGGMGIVYKAEDIRLKRTVALKFLPSDLTHIPDVKDRFMREAQAAAALDHPNICTVYEFDESEERSFISMAYIEGQSLRKQIDPGPLEIEEALKIATQVAEGLQEAHKKGIVHRDIKSANIMVMAKGQAKVMDFGLARVAGGTLVTKEGTTMGTIAYMSPEQARGEEVDQRTDIWSLGVVLYEMFSGHLPFRGDHEQSIVYSILKEKPKPITDIKAGIPVSIEQVVYRALEKDPDKRYQQIEELLDDLKSISAGIIPEEIKARMRKAKLLKRKRAILYAGASVVIIMAVLALTLFTGRAEAIDSIAVLPLQNQTGDAEKEYMVDGATNELIDQLSKIGALQVKSRTTIMQFKGVNKSIPEIARELKVDAVVEGTVYQLGESVRVTVRLYDALPEERSLWTETYDRAMTDVVVMYSEMARAIADKTRVKLTAEETARLSNARQVNPEAYEAYLMGMSHWYKLTPPDLDVAQQYFESAIEKDPNYALAHTGMFLTLHSRSQMGWVPPGEVIAKAMPFLVKALELDNTLPEAHFAMAALKTWNEWDWKGGETSFLRAIELNPNFAMARVYYSMLLSHLKRPEEAIAQAELALELDPLNSMFMAMYGNALVLLGRYDEAIVMASKAIRSSPNDPAGLSILWESLHMKGQYEEALGAAKAFYTGQGLNPIADVMSSGYETGGYSGAMKSTADTLAAISKETFIGPVWIAFAYGFTGEKEKALEWLEKAYEIKDPSMPFIGGHGVINNLLHDDPRYQDLLRRMGLPTEEKK